LVLRLLSNKIEVKNRSPEIDALIDQATRFQPKNYMPTGLLEGDSGDGYAHLYDTSRGVLPIGLLDRTEKMLNRFDVEYHIEDTRQYRMFEPLEISYESNLREYQIEALVKAIEAKRGVICLPCGTGKTLIGIVLTAELRTPTVFFVHKKELMYQTMKAYENEFGRPDLIGQVGDGVVDLKPITVAMVQSASKLPRELFTEYGLIIFDEVHHVPAESIYDIARYIESEYTVGLSATPMREDGKEMLIWAGTGPIIYQASTSDLINRGYLARPHIDYLEVSPVHLQPGLTYDTIYKSAVVFNDERNMKIALKAVDLAVFGKIYVHVRQILHGQLLTDQINELLPPEYERAEFIYGRDNRETRQRVMDAFRNQDLRILVSTLLGEGVDIPEMYALILASGGLSRIFVQQVFGRLLRIAEKPEVEFWDIKDQARHLERHFIERVRFYKSEDAFVLSPKMEAIEVPENGEEEED